MTAAQDDYVLTSELGEALVPLDHIVKRVGLSRATVWRDLRELGVTPIPYGKGSAVAWRHVVALYGTPH